MDVPAAKDRLHEELMLIDPEQFEHLCKILVEEVESPMNIELTPFGGDGGIDIRGTYGQSFFDPRFGIQVKQYSDNVHTPSMQKFVGALTHHDFQFGCFITSSDYSSDAIKLAKQQSIVLVDGSQLTDIMIAHEIGVTYSGFDYQLDFDFWEIFDKSSESEKIATKEIPQADSLDVLDVCLEAISKGIRFKPEISQYMRDNTSNSEWTPRQADYYPIAGWILGYLHKDQIGTYNGREMRKWGLTRDGVEYLKLSNHGETDTKRSHLCEHIRDAAIIQKILPVIVEKGDISRDKMIEIILEESDLTSSTPERRATTVGNWLVMLPEVRRVNDGNGVAFKYVSSRLGDYTDDSSM